MSATFDRHQPLLSEICEEWNTAEKVVKRAEQLVGDAVIPSINELRYAGRRLVDALCAISCSADDAIISDYLRDARFDCHRAQHDAIDATVLTIQFVSTAAEQKLGYDAILKAFNDYSKLRLAVQAINKSLAKSRENRKDREAIYQAIKNTDFEKLCTLYEEFQASEKVMKAIALSERRWKLLSIVGFVVGIMGLAPNVPSIWSWLISL
jgi:hypothetical protein